MNEGVCLYEHYITYQRILCVCVGGGIDEGNVRVCMCIVACVAEPSGHSRGAVYTRLPLMIRIWVSPLSPSLFVRYLSQTLSISPSECVKQIWLDQLQCVLWPAETNSVRIQADKLWWKDGCEMRGLKFLPWTNKLANALPYWPIFLGFRIKIASDFTDKRWACVIKCYLLATKYMRKPLLQNSH